MRHSGLFEVPNLTGTALQAGLPVPRSQLCLELREARNVVVGRFFVRLRYRAMEQRSGVSRESAFPSWKEEIVFEEPGQGDGSKDSPARSLKSLGQRNVRIDEQLPTLEIVMFRKSKWGADHEVGSARLDLSELRTRTRRAEVWVALRLKGQQSRIVGGHDEEATSPEVQLWLEFRHTRTERQWYRRNLHDQVIRRLSLGKHWAKQQQQQQRNEETPVLEIESRLPLDERDDGDDQNADATGTSESKGYGGVGFYSAKAPVVSEEMFMAYRDYATTAWYSGRDPSKTKIVGSEDPSKNSNKTSTPVNDGHNSNNDVVSADNSGESVYNRDWEINELLQFNSRFQDSVEVLNSDAWENAPDRILSAARSLITVSQDFLFSARTYGKIIISERFLPDDKKTIKPLASVGGKIGGIKYVHSGVFYKFALPDSKIITNVEDAAKVAGHELRGCMCYYNCAVPGLAVPLMCLVDYKGFRLIAITVLPIDRSTLVGGTSDAGRNIYSSDFVLNHKLAKAGQVLNLKQHKVRGHTIYSACDLEGHFNRHDGRYYLLDFSRVMPPAAPPRRLRNRTAGGIFVRMLRPELVSKHRVPLCPDAFSGFRDRSNKNRDEKEIVRASRDLSWLIPRYAAELSELVEQKLQDSSEDILAVQVSLSRLVHSKGINMRHLGSLFLDATLHSCRMLLLIEMAARAVKVLIRRRMRELMETLTFPLEQPYIEAVVQILNQVFGGDRSTWKDRLLPLIADYYGVSFKGPVAGVGASDGPAAAAAAAAAAVVGDGVAIVGEPEEGGGHGDAEGAYGTKSQGDPYDDLGSSQGSHSSSGLSEKNTLAPRKSASVAAAAAPHVVSSAAGSVPASGAAGGAIDDSGEDDDGDDHHPPTTAERSIFATLRAALWKKPAPAEPVPPSLPVADLNLDPAPALPPPRIDDPFAAIHAFPAGTSLLLMRVVAQLGLSLSDRVLRHVTQSLSRRQSAMLLTRRAAFDVSDLQELGERIKPLNIIPEAQGYVFVNQAKNAISVQDELHYYHLAIGCFNEALAGNTISKSVLRAYANVLVDMETALGHVLDTSSSITRRIAELYGEALRIDASDWITLRQYGLFLAKCGRVEEAMLAFLQSIFHSPNEEGVLKYAELAKGTREAEEILEAWRRFSADE